MRRFFGVLAVLVALMLAGCGSSSSGSSPSNPLAAELSYFPSGSPLVISVATDPNSAGIKQLQALIHRYTVATFGLAAVTAKLEQLGIDYQSDIRPLFGNPVMLGFATADPTGASARAFIGAWVTRDAGKLSALVKKIPGDKQVGSHDGATLYQAGGAVFLAVDGPTIVIGGSQSIVDAALDRHAGGGGMTSATYSQSLAGLPQNGFLQMFGNVGSVLAQPAAANARRIPWVKALRGYGVTVGASPTGVTLSFRLNTSGSSLTPGQVPLVTGNASPPLASSAPISIGMADPAHLAAFVEQAEQATSPAGWAKFERRQAALRAKTGTDLSALFKLLTGNLIVASDTHTTVARAGLSDPSAASRILAKLATAPHSAFNTTDRIHRLGGGFYAVQSPKETITLGVVGNQLVVGKATVAALRSFATAPATPATGARGSIAFRVGLASLIHLAMHTAPSGIAQTILSSLGDITGSVASSTSGITGTASLAIH